MRTLLRKEMDKRPKRKSLRKTEPQIPQKKIVTAKPACTRPINHIYINCTGTSSMK